MSSLLITSIVALGFGVMLVRRRSLAILLVGAQSILLGLGALLLVGDRPVEFLAAGAILLVRGIALPAFLLFIRRRTPESFLVAPTTSVLVRLVVASVVVLLAVASVPALGLADPKAEHATMALVTLGIAIVAMRRPAVLQILGILVAENGIYLFAISAPGGLPLIIELGVLFDLVLVVTVAAAFTHKIHGDLGSGDTDLLKVLRD